MAQWSLCIPIASRSCAACTLLAHFYRMTAGLLEPGGLQFYAASIGESRDLVGRMCNGSIRCSSSTTLWGGEQSHPAEARSIYYSERGHLTDWELTACERESLHMGEQVRPETDFVCGVSRGPPR